MLPIPTELILPAFIRQIYKNYLWTEPFVYFNSYLIHAHACITSNFRSQTSSWARVIFSVSYQTLNLISWNWAAWNSTSSLGRWGVRQVCQRTPGKWACNPAVPGWRIIIYVSKKHKVVFTSSGYNASSFQSPVGNHGQRWHWEFEYIVDVSLNAAWRKQTSRHTASCIHSHSQAYWNHNSQKLSRVPNILLWKETGAAFCHMCNETTKQQK